MEEEKKYILAFQQMTFNMPSVALRLFQEIGSAREIYSHRDNLKDIVPEISDNYCNLLAKDWNDNLRWAEGEIEWCEKKKIKILSFNDPDYPQRLTTCDDAPLVLFYRGNANLNSRHIISIVGTRNPSPYGLDITEKLITDLSQALPDLVVISGLAYGIDITSHRAALKNNLPTIGVVAHGLDTIYPALHRSDAVKMLDNGGLLSEYHTNFRIDKQNFLRRNRIVAGISDGTIVIESKSHGGSLVTARLADDYKRPIFAVPGRIGDKNSEGCNNIISNQNALMILSADTILDELNWKNHKEEKKLKENRQTELFVQLSPDQKLIAEILKDGDLSQNVICQKTSIPMGRLTAMLFEMEMQGVIKSRAGSMYHLNLL